MPPDVEDFSGGADHNPDPMPNPDGVILDLIDRAFTTGKVAYTVFYDIELSVVSVLSPKEQMQVLRAYFTGAWYAKCDQHPGRVIKWPRAGD